MCMLSTGPMLLMSEHKLRSNCICNMSCQFTHLKQTFKTSVTSKRSAHTILFSFSVFLVSKY